MPLLPDISFTDTITETLALIEPAGQKPALQAHSSDDLNVSQGGIIADSIILALISPILGGIGFIGGEIGAGVYNPGVTGVGASLANSWPAVILTGQPLVGKVTFSWSALTVDETGVRTQGSFSLAPRSPGVSIAGPTSVSFPQTHPSAVETYTAETTDLDNPTVVWSGAAQGQGTSVEVVFDREGTFHIEAAASDVDGVSAGGQISVMVTITKKGGGEPRRPCPL